MIKNLLISLFSFVIVLSAQAKDFSKLPTVNEVDVAQYVGKWYAISALPQFFTRKCIGQTAEYEILNSDKISVLNTCIKKNGSVKTIEGQAVVTNKDTKAELLVTFNNFWTKLFKVKGDYNIIKLGANYDTVMVASNNRKSLWIMSRVPSISQDTYTEYVKFAKDLGFETDKLIISRF